MRDKYTNTRGRRVVKNRTHIVTVHQTLPNIHGKTAGLNSRVANGQSAERTRNSQMALCWAYPFEVVTLDHVVIYCWVCRPEFADCSPQFRIFLPRDLFARVAVRRDDMLLLLAHERFKKSFEHSRTRLPDCALEYSAIQFLISITKFKNYAAKNPEELPRLLDSGIRDICISLSNKLRVS